MAVVSDVDERPHAHKMRGDSARRAVAEAMHVADAAAPKGVAAPALLAATKFRARKQAVLVPAPAPRALQPKLNDSEVRVVGLFSLASRSVVNVSTFSDFAGSKDDPEDSGSGFFYEKGGRCYVLTNHHVVNRSSGARVVLGSGKEFEARMRGYDANNDLAVLELVGARKSEMIPLKMGRSAGLVVGQSTYAIGNPFGVCRGKDQSACCKSRARENSVSRELCLTRTVGCVSFFAAGSAWPLL